MTLIAKSSHCMEDAEAIHDELIVCQRLSGKNSSLHSHGILLFPRRGILRLYLLKPSGRTSSSTCFTTPIKSFPFFTSSYWEFLKKIWDNFSALYFALKVKASSLNVCGLGNVLATACVSLNFFLVGQSESLRLRDCL